MTKTARFQSTLIFAIMPLWFVPGLARAGEDAAPDRLRGSAAIGIAAVPSYEGADDHRIIPYVDGRIQLGQRYLAVEGASLRANIVAADGIEFGPIANLTFGRSGKIKSAAAARLGEIKDAYEVGVFAAYSVPIAETDSIRFAVQGVHDISDVHDGFILTAGASYMAAVGERTTIAFDLGASFADDDYAATYFSVRPAAPMPRRLPGYAAKGGLKDAGASVTASYRIAKNWSIVGYAGYRRLLGNFADSPIVAREGSADQISGGIGIAHIF